MKYRTTLNKEVRCSGVGVHTGKVTTLVFKPAPFGQGIKYFCPDEMTALWKHVHSTHLSTKLQTSAQGPSVSMVEHMLSAFYGLGITDLTIEVDGNEAPIFDGSALSYVQTLKKAGTLQSRQETSWIVLHRPISIKDGDRQLSLIPGMPEISAHVTLTPTLSQSYSFNLTQGLFMQEIAPARTFARLADVQAMRDAGYIKGGSLSSAIVLHEGRPVNQGGFRLSHECARHKILDTIGDFALLGHFFYGTISALNSGHMLNHQMMVKLMSQADLFSYQKFSELPCQYQEKRSYI
jgi:UDP-3-O-[3-hydroxymyristoyl] N-acetylglucosamine deacetylase